jgi:hypothetical protein
VVKSQIFDNFVKSAQYKKHIGRLLLQLLKPKQLLPQPWLNGGQKSDFRQFRKSHPDKKRLFCLLLQLLKSKRLLAQPWLNGGQKSDFRQFHNSRSRQGMSGSPFIPIAQA